MGSFPEMYNILLVDIGAERCGSYGAYKTWKVGKFKNFIFSSGKSWKIKALQSNLRWLLYSG